MSTDYFFLGIDIVTVGLFLLVMLFSIGIVWRVEKELDWSYKFFVIAAASIVCADVLGLFVANQETALILVGKSLRFVGAVAFLISILIMRDIVRKLDHEKN